MEPTKTETPTSPATPESEETPFSSMPSWDPGDDVPEEEDVIAKALAESSSPAPSTGAPAAEEDILKNGPENVLHSLVEDRYYIRRKNGGWSDQPITSGALSQRLLSMGLPRAKQDSYKTHIKSYHHREAVFTAVDDLVIEDGLTVFNTYHLPKNLKPVQGDWSDIRATILNLVDGDEKACEYVIDWLAVPIQHMYAVDKNGNLIPHKGHFKMGTSIVLYGVQGSGKGTLEAIITALYGVDFVANVGQEALDGRFNGELVDKLFVIANEVMSSTNRSTQTANKIKPWITDHTIPVEEKFQGAKRVRNSFNIMFTSNDDRPVIIEKSDRRYSVFKSTQKLAAAIAERIHNDLKGDRKILQAFLHHLLLERKPQLKFGQLYHTSARDEMMMASAPSDEKFCEELERDGWFALASQWKNEAKNDEVRELVVFDNYVTNETLGDVYKVWCNKHNIKPRGQNFLAQTLRHHFPNVEQLRMRYGGIVRRMWKGLPMDTDDEPTTPSPVKEETKSTTDDADFT